MAVISQNNANTSIKLGEDTEQLNALAQIVGRHITIPESQRVDSQNVVRGVIAMSVSNRSISGYSQYHHGLPSHTTCLKVLHGIDMAELKNETPMMLMEAGRGVIKKGQKYKFAIDKTSHPYYGKRTNEPGSYIVGGKREASTNYFYTYLTVSIIEPGRHLTIAAIPWHQGMDNLTAIKQCIDVITILFSLKIECLCLDREFYVAEIFQYLQNEKIPHIVPVKEMGTKMKQRLQGRRSHLFIYTLNEGSDTPVNIQVVDCLVYMMGKNGKHGIEHHGFVVFMTSTSPRSIRELYKHRFAIETTYRVSNITRPKTTSRDPTIRFFYILVSFLIQNRWIALKWKKCAIIRRGPKVVDETRFPFTLLIDTIRSEAAKWFPPLQIEDIAIS